MNEDELTNNLKWLLDDLFNYLTERNRKAIIALWNGKHSQCWATVCGHQVCDVMDDIAKRLSQMPPAMLELMEGHHLLKSGEVADDMTLEMALKIPPEFQSVVVVFGDENDPEGDSAFCIGKPMDLCFLCVRSAACAEESMRGDNPHGQTEGGFPFIPPGIN